MKKLGAAMLVLGLLLTCYTALTSVTKAVDARRVGSGATIQDPYAGEWQPYLGIGIVVAGCLFVMRRKEE